MGEREGQDARMGPGGRGVTARGWFGNGTRLGRVVGIRRDARARVRGVHRAIHGSKNVPRARARVGEGRRSRTHLRTRRGGRDDAPSCSAPARRCRRPLVTPVSWWARRFQNLGGSFRVRNFIGTPFQNWSKCFEVPVERSLKGFEVAGGGVQSAARRRGLHTCLIVTRLCGVSRDAQVVWAPPSTGGRGRALGVQTRAPRDAPTRRWARADFERTPVSNPSTRAAEALRLARILSL